ncbi:hypothetical protein PSTG_15515 [Puccinia striiformis f. sp. tritici PST-78]|uniref:Core-binding (CB) domain-containing protein n=1 Tax=Puccinia striiformis f. sp. tritici PST-78 TaxID=1165861 RepID=A0A0L0UVU0_9BASI|nr:hypothetical protein PSTG_15515 [Puccinia striiformis f. sp. tritici PST-78]
MININKLSAFTADGNHPKKPSKDNVHYLHGFTKNTSIGYKTAVKKFNKSMLVAHPKEFRLPASAEDIECFCVWAGRVANRPTDHNVAAKTLTKYLSGLKAWHTYHRKPYPTSRAEQLVNGNTQEQAVAFSIGASEDGGGEGDGVLKEELAGDLFSVMGSLLTGEVMRKRCSDSMLDFKS